MSAPLALRFHAALLSVLTLSSIATYASADGGTPASAPSDVGFPLAPVPPQMPPSLPSLDFSVHMRAGGTIQNRSDPARLNGLSPIVDTDIYFYGQVHRMVGWMLTLGASIQTGPGATSSVNVTLLDAIGKLEPTPELRLWLGRMIVVTDRYAPGGPWGIEQWYYPGFYPGVPAPALPKSGPYGRDLGATLWGALLDARLKYYVGAYEFQDASLAPLLSARVQLDLWDPEPYYFQDTTYYGSKDVLAIGVGAQYQRNGSLEMLPPAAPAIGMTAAPRRDDHAMGTADFLLEKRFTGAGTLSIEGAASLFAGDYRAYDHSFLLGAGFLFPRPFGVGRLRPSVRYQQAALAAPGAGQAILVDVQLGYVIAGAFARVALGYRRSQLDLGAGSVGGNALFVGLTVADP